MGKWFAILIFMYTPIFILLISIAMDCREITKQMKDMEDQQKSSPWWIEDLYAVIRGRWHIQRMKPDADKNELKFLVSLMEEIEKHDEV